MDLVILLAIVVVITTVAVGLLVMRWMSTRESTRDASPRDDLQRAGSAGETTPYAASRRAEGDAAWTRIGGSV